MNEKELFQSFLNGFPASLHPLDRERFLKYAVAACKNDSSFGLEERNLLQEKGLSEDDIDYYVSAFGWIEETYKYLKL